jgi:hypothetical protein
MAPGGRYNLTVSVRNSGTVTWTRGGTNPFRLGLPYMWDIHTWGILTVDLPVDSVPPGADVSFSIPVTATTTLGTFNCRWQMEHGNGGWFGQVTPGGLVTIATGSASFPHASAGVGGGLL